MDRLTEQLEELQRGRQLIVYAFVFFAVMFVAEAIAGFGFGRWFSHRLETERKSEFSRAFDNYLHQRWNFHSGAVTGYAWWDEPWNLAKKGRWGEAKALFEGDPTLQGSFDYFAVYSQSDTPRFGFPGAGNTPLVIPPDIVHFLVESRSMQRGETNLILRIGDKPYLVTAAAMADAQGRPQMPGICVFAFSLDRFLISAREILPATLELAEDGSGFLSVPLVANMRSTDAPLYVRITPNTLMEDLIRNILLAFLAFQIVLSILLFAVISPRYVRERTMRLEKMVRASRILNRELELRVDELTAARTEIQKSEKKYRDLVESSREIIFSIDSKGNITTINQAVSSLLGFQPESLIGKGILDLIYVSPDRSMNFRREFISEQIESVIQNQKAASFKTEFVTRYNEPRELETTLEYVPLDGGYAIFGKAASMVEDMLATYCERESMKFVIGNYLTLSEQISQRVTNNLGLHCDASTTLQIRICVSEMIINGIEHGNLGITYEEKTNATEDGSYLALLRRRQFEAPYSSRKLKVVYSLNPRRLLIVVQDEGAGFNHTRILKDNSMEANKKMHLHGRGITMAKSVFDSMRYNEKGNRVALLKRFRNQTPPTSPGSTIV